MDIFDRVFRLLGAAFLDWIRREAHFYAVLTAFGCVFVVDAYWYFNGLVMPRALGIFVTVCVAVISGLLAFSLVLRAGIRNMLANS